MYIEDGVLALIGDEDAAGCREGDADREVEARGKWTWQDTGLSGDA